MVTQNNTKKTCLFIVLIYCLQLSVFLLSAMAGQEQLDVHTDNAGKQNQVCLDCHDGRQRIDIVDTGIYSEEGDERQLTAIIPERYGAGVHAQMACIACHKEIVSLKPPHQAGVANKIDCADCHVKLLTASKKSGTLPQASRLEVVVQNSKNYQASFHARPNKDDERFANAWCDECHDAHFFNVPVDKNSPAYIGWRKAIPDMCGKCHEYALEKYVDSVHGVELLEKHNANSANCTDCHPAYMKGGAHIATFKIGSQDSCGVCHPVNLASYRNSYHGQVTKLGYTHTAKCFDCHESHKTLRVDNPLSMVHPDNRLKTCQKCHDGKKRPLATAGFVSYSPHAHAGDYALYPEVWTVSRFMQALIIGVLLFFWLHSVLWFYREWREQKHKPVEPPVELEALEISPGRYFQRFTRGWRIIHALFALITMAMMLTGLSLKYAHAAWAPVVAKFMGGVEQMGLVHRILAIFFVGIFFLHASYLLRRLLRDSNFLWFGLDSLIPNWKDFADCRDMFKWFLGRGTKPRFDRWTYFEKFGYWAVFWGVMIIGSSGLFLAFPEIVAQYFKGWVFNVALIMHGEEAVLTTLFLFTVHLFNNHFRPSKLPPPDIVMFSGCQSLKDFQREHPAQFERLRASGELQRQLVAAPAKLQIRRHKIEGMTLIAIGLLLLAMVLNGMLTA